tara:strand:- start:552 stop:803 length:252 start_codon:yes stop_codon:yes gene_type:complete
MPRFILTATDDDNTITSKEFDSSYITDVVDKASDFFRGVGFCFDEISVSNESRFDDVTLEDTRTDVSDFIPEMQDSAVPFDTI